MARQLVGGSKVHFERVSFLPVGILGAVAAVHVYYVKRLSVLNNQVGTALVRDGFAERRLDLFGDTEIVVNGKLPFIQLHDVRPVGGDECHVVFDFVIHGLVVDVYVRTKG